MDLFNSKDHWLYFASANLPEFDEYAYNVMNMESSNLVRILRGAHCRTERELFHEFSAALQFPYFFGNNWDALLDLLVRLSWYRFEGIVLLISDTDEVLVDEEASFGTLLQVLEQCASIWSSDIDIYGGKRSHYIPFRVLLHSTPSQEMRAWERLDMAGFARKARTLSELG